MTHELLASVREHRVFGQRRVMVRLAPFLLAYLVAFAVFPIGDGVHYGWSFALAVIAAAVVLATVALAPWEKLPAAASLGPLLLYLGSVVALRDAHGGAGSGYAPMVIVAAVWVAIFGAPWMVAVVIAGVAVALAFPPLIADAPFYPDSEFRRAFLAAVVASLAAGVIQTLVRALVAEFERRERSERQLSRLRATEIHDDIVQSIAVAQIGLSVNDRASTDRALANALSSAQKLVADLFAASGRRTEPGELRRRRPGPALVERKDAITAAPPADHQR